MSYCLCLHLERNILFYCLLAVSGVISIFLSGGEWSSSQATSQQAVIREHFLTRERERERERERWLPGRWWVAATTDQAGAHHVTLIVLTVWHLTSPDNKFCTSWGVRLYTWLAWLRFMMGETNVGQIRNTWDPYGRHHENQYGVTTLEGLTNVRTRN